MTYSSSIEAAHYDNQLNAYLDGESGICAKCGDHRGDLTEWRDELVCGSCRPKCQCGADAVEGNEDWMCDGCVGEEA